jgi:DNA-binding beta-propeller fold protein YncE
MVKSSTCDAVRNAVEIAVAAGTTDEGDVALAAGTGTAAIHVVPTADADITDIVMDEADLDAGNGSIVAHVVVGTEPVFGAPVTYTIDHVRAGATLVAQIVRVCRKPGKGLAIACNDLYLRTVAEGRRGPEAIASALNGMPTWMGAIDPLGSWLDLGSLRGPHGLAFVGGKLWFTAEGAGVVGVYDPATRRVDSVLATGQARTHMIHVSADAARLVTTNTAAGTVTIARRAAPNGWEQTVIPSGAGVEGFDVTPDGREIWAASAQDGTITIIDAASRRVARTLDAHVEGANRLKITPDGKLALVSTLRGPDLAVFDVAARREVKRIPVGHGAAGILVQPDGARAYVACTPDDYVAVIDLGSLGQKGSDTDVSVALGINNKDQVVGYTYLPAFGEMPVQQVAFLWSRNARGIGKMVNLNNVLNETGKNYIVISATGINEYGQVVASAYDIYNGGVRSVLLTPVKQ